MMILHTVDNYKNEFRDRKSSELLEYRNELLIKLKDPLFSHYYFKYKMAKQAIDEVIKERCSKVSTKWTH
jgi:hypothetical protein